MIKVGITGGIGSGKSTLCRIIGSHGVPVFYADDEARWIIGNDLNVREAIIAEFGGESYLNGVFNRKWIGEVIFNNPDRLNAMNRIMRPAVSSRFIHWCSQQQTDFVLMESAVLIENGKQSAVDHIVVVTAPFELRLQRAMSRDSATEEQIRARMNSQLTEQALFQHADSIIVNDTAEHLERQATELMSYLKGSTLPSK